MSTSAERANRRFAYEVLMADNRARLRQQSLGAKAHGYLQQACTHCGEYKVRHDGTTLICDFCGENDTAPNST